MIRREQAPIGKFNVGRYGIAFNAAGFSIVVCERPSRVAHTSQLLRCVRFLGMG